MDRAFLSEVMQRRRAAADEAAAALADQADQADATWRAIGRDFATGRPLDHYLPGDFEGADGEERTDDNNAAAAAAN